MVLGATFEADLIFVYLIEEDAMGWQVQNGGNAIEGVYKFRRSIILIERLCFVDICKGVGEIIFLERKDRVDFRRRRHCWGR